MHVLIPGLCLALSLPAAAGKEEETELSPEEIVMQNNAEYIRLSQALEDLASRNAWSGVERTYQSLLETGVTPSFNDQVTAAHAARKAGDVSAVRERLLAANAHREDKSVIDWLWEIDSNYGVVHLSGDPGKVSLTPESMPFNPDQAAAVQYAVARIEATGSFEGLLPQGRYRFADQELEVKPRVSSVRIDVRSSERKSRPRK